MRFFEQLVYSLVVYLLLPVLFGYFAWRSLREADYRRGWPERLGFIGRHEPGAIWLHAASVGEAQAALPLVERLLKRYPERRVVITNFTPTGAALIKTRLGQQVEQLYLPVDTPLAVARFLRRLRPAMGVIVETELWPNLLLACGRRGLPMLLASATLSERSARRYRRFPGLHLMRAAMQAFQVVAVQSHADANRFMQLGVYEGRIEVSGNLKFDLTVPDDLAGKAATLRHDWSASARPLWLAASTHEGEEQMALAAFDALRPDHPGQLLVLVPRHPQRFDAVAGLLERSNLRFVRRSSGQPVTDQTQVLLVDTLGELMLFYAMADIAFVGGSLVPIGGHNLLEPAALGKPILTGPHYHSQQQLYDLLSEKNAIRCVADQSELIGTLQAMLASPDSCRVMGQDAQAVLAANRGALAAVEGAVTRGMLQALAANT